MLLFHIIIACGSIGLFAGRIFSTDKRLAIAANLTAVATVATGGILVLDQTTSLSHACISGVVYLASVVALSRVATLAQARAKINH